MSRERFIIFILNIVLMFNCISVHALTPKESTTSNYENMYIKLLSELKVTKNVDIEENLKYTDAAAVVRNILGADHEIVKRNEKFKTDKDISVYEFVHLLVNVAGYRDYVNVLGDNKGTYNIIAKKYGLYDGLSVGINDSSIDGASAMEMIYNFLNMPMCSIKSVTVSGDGTALGNIEISDDCVVAEAVLGLERTYGRIAATEHIALKGYNVADESKITFASDRIAQYRIDDKNINSYIGYKGYLYSDKENLNVIGFVSREESEDIVIYAEDVAGIDNSISYIKYGKGNRTIDLKFNENTIFVLNGKMTFEILPAHFTAPGAKITIRDIDNSAGVDLVYIENYKFIYTKGINYTYQEITDVNTKETFSFKQYSDSAEVNYIKDGKYITFDEIIFGQDCVFSISESIDKKLVNVYISDKVISGKIDLLSKDKVTIGGQKYTAICSLTGLDLKNQYDFVVNHNGYIVAIGTSLSDDLQYGFVLGIKTDSFTGEIQLKMLSSDNRMLILDAAKNFRINDIKVKADVVETKFEDAGGNFKPQLASYYLNKDKQISRMYLSDGVATPPAKIQKPTLTLNRHYSPYSTVYRGGSINCEYITDINTIGFVIVTDKFGNVKHDLCYSALPPGAAETDIKVYDSNYARQAAVMVFTIEEDDMIDFASGIGNHAFVVSNIVETLRNGDRVRSVEGWQHGALTYYDETKFVDIDSLKFGDVIIPYLNVRNELVKYEKVFELNGSADSSVLSSGKTYGNEDYAISGSNIADKGGVTALYGRVLTKCDLSGVYKGISLQLDGTNDVNGRMAFQAIDDYVYNGYNPIQDGVSVYWLHTESQTITPGGYTALDVGDKIFAHINRGIAYTIVVIDKE